MRAPIVVLAAGFLLAACGTTAVTPEPSTAVATPWPTLNGTVGTAFQSGDCTAAAAGATTPAASSASAGEAGADGFTLALPSGWTVQPGASKEVALQVADSAGVVLQVVESTEPAGGVQARLLEVYETASRGAQTSSLTRCTVAGEQASAFAELPGSSPVVYFVVLSHADPSASTFLYVVTISVPVTQDPAVMPQVKAILGSWTWAAA